MRVHTAVVTTAATRSFGWVECGRFWPGPEPPQFPLLTFDISWREWQLYNLSISAVKGFRGDKLARLRGIMGLFEHKKIIFNKYRDFSCMVDEIVNFGHSPHDDCADSLNIVVQGLMRRGKAQIEWN